MTKARVTKGAKDENVRVLAYLRGEIARLEEEGRAAGEVAGARPELAGVLGMAQRVAAAKAEAYRDLALALGAGEHRKGYAP